MTRVQLADGYTLDTHAPRALDADAMRALHSLADAMAAEPYDHFLRHAHDNHVLYVFRDASGEVAGFQFFKTFGEPDGTRYVLGGKLRVRPEARRKGLHIAAGLDLLKRQREGHPGARLRRLAIVNPFGFVSLVRRLKTWDFIGPGTNEDLHPIVAREAALSHYRFDTETGLCHVGIVPTQAQVERYPASFWASELVRAYLDKNPRYRENGTNLALVFDADDGNLGAMERSLAELATP